MLASAYCKLVLGKFPIEPGLETTNVVGDAQSQSGGLSQQTESFDWPAFDKLELRNLEK